MLSVEVISAAFAVFGSVPNDEPGDSQDDPMIRCAVAHHRFLHPPALRSAPEAAAGTQSFARAAAHIRRT